MNKKANAFTIVELLIVIVVMAILAAISIVAYRGIQDRANESSAQAAARQAASKLQIALIESDLYPTSLSDVGINDSDSTKYQYRVDNNVSPKTYCATVTSGNKSYYISNSSTSPLSGGCSGHGQGGIAAITNLVSNPSFESNANSWTRNDSIGTNSRMTDGGFSGSGYRRYVITNAVTQGNVGIYTPVNGLNGTSSYRAIAYVRSNANIPFKLHAERRNAANSGLGTVIGSTAPAGAGWTRINIDIPPTPNLDRVVLTVYSATRAWTVGDQFDIDAVMMVEGTETPTYADGNSPNWDWNGTQNNSSSSGPPL